MPTTPRNRLGDLERAVMEELWTTSETHPDGLTVRAVHDRIGLDRGLAYTTLMTVHAPHGTAPLPRRVDP